MFQMLVPAKGQSNLLRVPGGAGDGVGAGVAVGLAVAVDVAVGVGVGCEVLAALGATDEARSPSGLGVMPLAGVLVPVGRDIAWPHAPRASNVPVHSARRRPCRAPNARCRGCTPDSDVFLTST
jgi:hypothetical protein